MSWDALEGSPLLAFLTDREGVVIRTNPAAGDRWAIGRHAADGFPADRRGQVGEAVQALASGQTTAFEWGEHGPGGVRRWYVCTASRHGGADTDHAFLFVSTDVTELKRSEERLQLSERMMVDAQGVAHLGTWDWDVTQPNATWSDELYRIYGLTPETYTPSYEAYLQMVHPDDRQRVMDATNAVFHQHVPYSHDERILRPDGSMRYLHTWARPILDDAGKLVRLVGVCQDITDRKVIEEELRVLNLELERRVADRTRRLEQSMKDLEAFNAIVSHDLRAPLSVIQLSATLVQQYLQPSPPERVVDRLRKIVDSVSHMTSLVDALLTLARVGHVPLRQEPVDVSALARDLLAELARMAPERRVEVKVAPGIVWVGDAELTRTAMQNLLGNAWKYTSHTADACIEVGATLDERRVTLHVRDNGAGFDMAQAHRLFAPFERLHEPSQFPGTGVGLAAVHRIVERHGGRIWAEGERGRGATFFIELPVRTADGSEPPPRAGATEP